MICPYIDQYALITREIERGDFEYEIIDNTKAVLIHTPTFAAATEDNPFYLALEVNQFNTKSYDREFLLDGVRYIYDKGTEIEADGVEFYFCDEDFNKIEKPGEWQLLNNHIKKVLLNKLVQSYAEAC